MTSAIRQPQPSFRIWTRRTVLDRGIAALGIYPAVDPLHSASRILGQRHRRQTPL